ncbi:hypothetical protein JZ751_024136 [Albula glossodonta]|uniref:Voltage-dependent calcium channel alpha-2/delta subunit conserved region domain-containing protein n=1 Tax=Albula glossodonta TaxID=121402 RepID=A0A8T2NFG0_9TELE|nr:hypothetical protein JZ751_024136 [Albula glossodonta]
MRQVDRAGEQSIGTEQCSRVDGACPLDCESLAINCYLIDSNGFILVTRDKKEVGKFLGELEGAVMTQLLRMGMFKRVSLYDYQAMCKNPHAHASSARPLLSFNICGLWHSDNLADAHKHKKVELLQPCDTEYPSFVYEPSIKETNSYVQCARCQKMFVLQQIANSNLIMVVIQADCDCSRKYSAITLDPKECDRMKSQKIRRRPDSCHAFHPEENAKDCGGASEISLSLALFLVSLATSALVSR